MAASKRRIPRPPAATSIFTDFPNGPKLQDFPKPWPGTTCQPLRFRAGCSGSLLGEESRLFVINMSNVLAMLQCMKLRVTGEEEEEE